MKNPPKKTRKVRKLKNGPPDLPVKKNSDGQLEEGDKVVHHVL